MASTRFPVTTHRIVAPSRSFLRPLELPSRRGPWELPALLSRDIYAQILCEGGNGESLLLSYLRPDTGWPNERPQKPVHRNRWDPATQSGVAYFPASAFAIHERLVAAPARVMQPSVFAEVDDVYPGGNCVLNTMPLLPVTQDPVPDLRNWLQQHPEIRGSLKWSLDNLGVRDFSAWPQTRQPGQLVNQQDLIDAFSLAWNYAGPDLDDPPPNLVDYDTFGVVIDEAHAWPLYIAHAAHSLALEIGRRVPWSLTDYSFDDRERILHSGSIVRQYAASASPVPNVKCYKVEPISIPASPRFAYSFLVRNGLIDRRTDAAAARKATIANVLGGAGRTCSTIWEMRCVTTWSLSGVMQDRRRHRG